MHTKNLSVDVASAYWNLLLSDKFNNMGLCIKVFFWFVYRNANKGDQSDFISVKGDVEMDLDINKEMTRDQEEAMMNS